MFVGAVSQAILSAAGPGIIDECKRFREYLYVFVKCKDDSFDTTARKCWISIFTGWSNFCLLTNSFKAVMTFDIIWTMSRVYIETDIMNIKKTEKLTSYKRKSKLQLPKHVSSTWYLL